jgi:hypothetical protein
MNDNMQALAVKPIRSQYVFARRLGSSDTVMMTVDEAQRRGFLVLDYESKTYRPVDDLSPGSLRGVPTPDSVKY